MQLAIVAIKTYLNIIIQRLRGGSNFHEARTLDGVILQLNNMTAELEENDTVELEELKEVKKSCREFFIAFVLEEMKPQSQNLLNYC